MIKSLVFFVMIIISKSIVINNYINETLWLQIKNKVEVSKLCFFFNLFCNDPR
jgi:hypothetical protein